MTDDSIDALLGDLEEEYAFRAGNVGRLRALVWYWKETALMVAHAGSRSVAFAAIAGILAGVTALLIGLSSTRGPLELYPYAVLILVFIAYLRLVPTRILRLTTVFVGTLTTMLVQYFGLYSFDRHVATIPLSGHAWRMGFILAVAAGLSLTLSHIAPRVPSHPYPFAFAMGFFGSAALWMTLLTRRLTLLPVVLALLLLSTGVYLNRQGVERFVQRLVAGLVICTAISGLACLFLVVVVNPQWAGIAAWEQLFQHGLLYLEIVVASIVLAAATKRRTKRVRSE